MGIVPQATLLTFLHPQPAHLYPPNTATTIHGSPTIGGRETHHTPNLHPAHPLISDHVPLQQRRQSTRHRLSCQTWNHSQPAQPLPLPTCQHLSPGRLGYKTPHRTLFSTKPLHTSQERRGHLQSVHCPMGQLLPLPARYHNP